MQCLSPGDFSSAQGRRWSHPSSSVFGKMERWETDWAPGLLPLLFLPMKQKGILGCVYSMRSVLTESPEQWSENQDDQITFLPAQTRRVLNSWPKSFALDFCIFFWNLNGKKNMFSPPLPPFPWSWLPPASTAFCEELRSIKVPSSPLIQCCLLWAPETGANWEDWVKK